MAQNKDIRRFSGGLNKDDNPTDPGFQPNDYLDALNMRAISSNEQQGIGNMESIQGEIEIIINVTALYYGGAIGGKFIYDGFEEVTLCNQTWMKRNYTKNYPGSKVYNNDEANRLIYGALYNWAEINEVDFAPEGWRVPTEADIDALLACIGGAMLGGGKLKEFGDTHWIMPNTGSTDEFGFTALPAGMFDTVFSLLGLKGSIWMIDEAIMYPPVAVAATNIICDSFTANWNASVDADGYYLDVSTDPAFGSFIAGFNNLDVGNVLTYSIPGLTEGTDYYYRLRSYDSSSTSVNSNVISVTTAETATLLITSQGTGLGVAEMRICTSVPVTITLSGVAKFYSDTAGTLNESSSWTTSVGTGYQLRYVRCSSGTANMTFCNKNNLIAFGGVARSDAGNSGWFPATGSAWSAVPFLNCANWDFPNCVDIMFAYPSISDLSCPITTLSSSLVNISLAAGTLTGDLSDIPATCIKFGSFNNSITGDVADLPAVMTDIYLSGSTTITGDIADLPAGMLLFQIQGLNTLFGDIADIPVNTTKFYVSGNNTISGDIADIPATITTFAVLGNTTITGDINDLLNTVTYFDVRGTNTISGDLINMPSSMQLFVVYGSNTITGGFTAIPNSCKFLTVGGSNTVNGDIGDLPTDMYIVEITGNNTVSGSLASIGGYIHQFTVYGTNTISGDISDIDASTNLFRVLGSTTITGDVGDMPVGCNRFTIRGTVSDYTGKTWTNTSYEIYLLSTGGGMSSAEVDQLLIDIDAGCTFTGIWKYITIAGTHGSPTAASLAARNSLIAKGVTLTTNP